MSRHGAFHESFRRSHSKSTRRPTSRSSSWRLIMFGVIGVYSSASGRATLDAFNDAGTMGAFGFCGAYALVCISAPSLPQEDRPAQRRCAIALSVAGIADVGHSRLRRGISFACSDAAGQLLPGDFRGLPADRSHPRDRLQDPRSQETRSDPARSSPRCACRRAVLAFK